MRDDVDLSRLVPREPLTVFAFILLLLAVSTTYGLTAAGHYSTFEESKVTGTVVGYHVEETPYGPVVAVAVRVRNPLLRPIVVGAGSLDASADGRLLADGGSYRGVTVPAEGTATVTFALRPLGGRRSAALRAARRGQLRVRGVVWAELVEYQFQFVVHNGTVASDA